MEQEYIYVGPWKEKHTSILQMQNKTRGITIQISKIYYRAVVI